jgi:hypothetical protein
MKTTFFISGVQRKVGGPSGIMAELANALVIHSKHLGSNLGIDRKYFLILLVSHMNSNL